MASLYRIPLLASSAWYPLAITLQGVRYVLEMRWNDRASLWVLGFRDASQNPILMGIPLHVGRDLIGQYSALALPQGLFWVADKSGAEQDPGLLSFGSTHALYFLDTSGA